MPRPRRPLALLTLALAAAGLTIGTGAGLTPGPGSAAAAAPTVGRAVIELDGQPESLATDPTGRLWVVLSNNSAGNELARVTAAGAVSYVDLDTAPGLSDVTVGPGPRLWGTYDAGVVRIPLGDPTAEVATAVPGWGSDPRGITRGARGTLWAGNQDTVWRIDPADPAAASPFVVPGLASRELTTASDGRVWVADASGRVHAFRPDGTHVTRDVGGMVQGITAGPRGQVLYTNPGADPHHVARITFRGVPRRTPLPVTDPSFSAARGPDGNYWVGLFLTRQVARVTPDGAVRRFGAFPEPYRPRHVAAGRDGVVWIGLQDPGSDGAVGRVRGLTADRRVGVGVGATRLDADRRGRVVVPLTCPRSEASGPCRGRVRLTARAAVIGRGTFRAAPGRTARVVVRLSRPARARLRRDGSLGAALHVRVADGAGNTREISRGVRIVR